MVLKWFIHETWAPSHLFISSHWSTWGRRSQSAWNQLSQVSQLGATSSLASVQSCLRYDCRFNIDRAQLPYQPWKLGDFWSSQQPIVCPGGHPSLTQSMVVKSLAWHRIISLMLSNPVWRHTVQLMLAEMFYTPHKYKIKSREYVHCDMWQMKEKTQTPLIPTNLIWVHLSP